MTAAATVTVSILDTRLAIALVISTVNLATVLASISGHLVGPRVHRFGYCVFMLLVLILLVDAVVDKRSKGARTETVFNQGVALETAISG